MLARILASLTLVFVITTPASAHRVPPPDRARVDVELLCDGSRCDEVRHRGQRYVVGEHGSRYAIALTNRSGGWVEVVVAVDGRSVTDGQRIGTRSRGYLLPPNDRIELEGWRMNHDEVAAFRFTSVGDSYAGRIGDAAQAGTIRVDVYPERRRPDVWVPPPQPRRFYNEGDARPTPEDAPAKSRVGAAESSDGARWHDRREQNLGTQYGETRTQRVEQRDFDRADPNHPAQSLTLRYDDRRGLASRGVLDEPHRREVRWVPPPPPLRIDD